MSKYTTELRYICEKAAGLETSDGYNSIATIIDSARHEIFDFDYPIFDNNYREALEKLILRHFYTREICEETYGLWKLRLEDKMNVIMPYYNQLFESTLIEFNPLIDTEYSVNHIGENKQVDVNLGSDKLSTKYGKVEGKNIEYNDKSNKNYVDTTSEDVVNTANSTDYALNSDTPEGGINGIEVLEMEHSVYLTDAQKNTSSSNANEKTENVSTKNGSDESLKTGSEINTTGGEDTNNKEFTRNSNKSSTDNYIDMITGKKGVVSYSKMLKEFRETFININKMILNELEDLFFMLW